MNKTLCFIKCIVYVQGKINGNYLRDLSLWTFVHQFVCIACRTYRISLSKRMRGSPMHETWWIVSFKRPPATIFVGAFNVISTRIGLSNCSENIICNICKKLFTCLPHFLFLHMYFYFSCYNVMRWWWWYALRIP